MSTTLRGKRIDFTAIDGADPANKVLIGAATSASGPVPRAPRVTTAARCGPLLVRPAATAAYYYTRPAAATPQVVRSALWAKAGKRTYPLLFLDGARAVIHMPSGYPYVPSHSLLRHLHTDRFVGHAHATVRYGTLRSSRS